ncbi:MAG: DNA-directed DNA polymerase [Candidatus Aenigmatarchaeota archaeon]
MIAQIIDVDYISGNDGPIIRIFARNDSGPVCIFCHDFEPYFYAESIDGFEKDLDAKIVEKEVIGKGKTKLYLIKVKNPADVPLWRERLRQAGIKTYEADILFNYRFMIDNGLVGMGWIDVEGEPVNTQIVPIKSIKAKKIVPIVQERNVNLKILAFDIECVSETGKKPEAKNDPIILISFAFNQKYEGKENIILSTRRGKGVNFFSDEKEMLEEFIKIVNGYDPDIICGYNCNNFDIPYILERMSQYGIKPLFGRCRQKAVSARKIGIKHRVSIPGRVVADIFEIVKKDFPLYKYDLDFVCRALLGEGKKEVLRLSKIRQFWYGNDEEFQRLVEYNKIDSLLLLELVEKLHLFDKYFALSAISGILLQDAFEGGESTKIENFLLRKFNENGYVLPCKPSVEIKGSGLEGGEVLEPIKGLHSNVVVLDFKSMYPSIIKTFNICPTTLCKNGDIIAPSGVRFLSPEKKQGIIPLIVDELMIRRQKVKKQLKSEKNEVIKRSLDAHQWALKILANAFYGYFGYTRSRLFNLDIANAITSFGRDMIIKTKSLIESGYGFRVVYGDTDSVFVEIPGKDIEEVIKRGRELAENITSQLPKGIELEFEKVLLRFLPLTKKRYAGLAIIEKEDGYDYTIVTKGIETIRRDWCPLVEKVLKEILEIVFKKNDVKAAIKRFREISEMLMRGEIDISDLTITKTITKAPKAYDGIQPHIEVVKKIKSRGGSVPDIGDRVGYVIVKGTQNISKRAEDPIWVKEKKIPIDHQYYIENQLLPPLERIFFALGIPKSQLIGGAKQTGLFETLNGIKKDVINGFICTACSKWWERPPLNGRCDCSGEIAFSSQNGPVKKIEVT